MHFSDIIGNQGSNDIWRYFWFLHWQNLPLQPLTTPLMFFSWSVNYANLVYKLFIMFWECQDTQILFTLVYIGINTFFSTEIYRKIIFNSLLFFQLYLLVSILYELSQQIPQCFFRPAPELRLNLYLMAWSIMLHGKFISKFLVLL